MSSRIGSSRTNTILGSPALAAETIIATTGPLSPVFPNSAFDLWWFIEFLVGTSGTGATVRIRRGPLVTSPLVNVGQASTVVAANLVRFSGYYFDLPGDSAGLQYTLTLQIAAGAAASTVSDVALTAACI